MIISLFTIFMFSCKSDSAKSDTNKSSKESTETPSASIKNARERALNTIEYRRLNIENKSYRTMDSGVLVYEAIFDPSIKQIPVPTVGKWIDFNVDFTYQYGTYGNKEGEGMYYYSFSDQLLLMVDNDPNKIPEEFEVKVSGTAQVWVGKNTYSNNGKQIKLIKEDKRPSK